MRRLIKIVAIVYIWIEIICDDNISYQSIKPRTEIRSKNDRLLPNSTDAEEIISAIESGLVPRSITAAKISKMRTSHGSTVGKYSTRSVNDFLNNYRKSTKSSKSMLVITFYSVHI